jgi:hypothetical protein
MADADHIADLMSRLGPTAPGVEAVLATGTTAWTVLMTDGREIRFDLDTETGGLTAATGLGRPQPGDRLKVYEAALLFNTLWRQSGGLRLAMAGEHGPMSLGLELPAAAMDLEGLQTVLAALAARGTSWSDFVAGTASGPEPVPASLIRV